MHVESYTAFEVAQPNVLISGVGSGADIGVVARSDSPTTSRWRLIDPSSGKVRPRNGSMDGGLSENESAIVIILCKRLSRLT